MPKFDWSAFDQPTGTSGAGTTPKRKYDWDSLAKETLEPARKPAQEGAGQALPPENEVTTAGVRIEGPKEPAEPGYRRVARTLKETAQAAGAGIATGTLGLSESLYRLPEAAARTAAGGLDTFTRFKDEAVSRLGSYAEKYKLPKPTPESVDAFLTGFSPILAKSRETAEALRIVGPLVGRGEIAGKKYGIDFRGRKFGGLSDVADEIHLAQTLLPELHPAFKRNADLAQEADLGMTELLQGRPERMKNVVLDPRAWAGFIGQAVPSLVTAAASGGSLGVMGVMEALDTANDAADFEKRTGIKMSDAEFAQALTQTGFINAKLEAIGLGQVLKKVPARPFLKAIMQRGAAALTEGVTEALQQFNSNWSKKLAYDPTQSLMEGVVPSAMGGMGSGAAFGGHTEQVESGTQAGEGQPNIRIEGPKPSPVELLDSLAETIKEDPNLSPVRKDALIEIVWENRKELMEYFADDRKSPEEILRRIQEIESKNHDQRDPVTQEVVKPAEAISGDEAVESEILKQDLKVGNHKPSEATMQEKVMDAVAGAIVEGFDQEARSAAVETRMIARKARKSKGPLKGKQTIIAEVRKRGGVTMKSVKAAGYTWQDIKEFGLLGIINNKSNMGFDMMANSLLEEGIFNADPNKESITDAFMRHLKDKATSAYADAADEMEAEYEKKYQEYVERYGEPQPGEVGEADRTAQAQAQSEILSETGGEDAFLDPDEVAGVLRQLDLEEEARGITQKDIVKEVIAKEPKTIKEIAQVTGILEPNVRRILGVGAKDGTFTRVDKGVYVLRQAGQDIAYIQAADASETLPQLVEKGMKFDAVLLDIPYDTPAVRGGNRGANRQYNLMSVDSWRKIAQAISKGLRDDQSPVYYMYSQARSGMAAMQKYNDVLGEVGLKPVARGEYTKLQLDGVTQVRNMRGDVVLPEGIILLTRSGQFTEKAEARNLNFKLIRPRGYSTEKPAEMIRSLIMQGTDEGDWVLDPTAGSGVTPAEAVRAGRRAIALEINPDVVQNRIIPRVEAALRERERMPKYKRIAKEFGPKKGSPEAIIEAAKKEFGTTPYFEGAGYMTPDGELIDFSEQNDGGDPFVRSLDHRAIERILPEKMQVPAKEFGARSRNMFKFMELGNIRLQRDGFQAVVKPTPAQERAIVRLIRQLQEGGFDVNIDIGVGDEAKSFSFGTEMNPAYILDEVRRAFDETYPKYKTIAPPFFSALERVIREKMPNAAPAEMVKNLVNPAKGSGISQGELDWVGLEQFLEGKEKVTKDEVLAFIDANGIKIREIVKKKGVLSPEAQALKKTADDARAAFVAAHDAYKKAFKAAEEAPTAKEAYSKWKNADIERQPVLEKVNEILKANDKLGFDTLPEARQAVQEDDFTGAFPDAPAELKDLGKKLRAMNNRVAGLKADYNDLVEYDANVQKLKDAKDSAEIASERAHKAFVQEANKDEPEHERYTEPGGENYQELLLTLVDPSGDTLYNAPGAHFKEANILVHVRMKDRFDAEGNKILALEEVQSDWHQEGRESGYGEPKPWVVYNEDDNAVLSRHKTKEEAEAAADKEREDGLPRADVRMQRRDDAVPNAPFKKNWHEFAMKRMLRWAAQHGYQKLAWTTGTMQAERWNQIQEIADVQVTTSKGKRGWGIEAHSSDGGLEVSQWVDTQAELEKWVGKELADVIRPMEGKTTKQVLSENHPLVKDYEGAILVVPATPIKIGGEGMKGFYDKMLTDFLNKYTKKWGGKVGEVMLPIPVGTGKGRLRFEVHDPEGNVYDAFETRQAADEAAKNAGKGYYVAGKSYEDTAFHSIDITPAMFDSVIHEGQKFSTQYTKNAGDKIRLTVEAKKLVDELLPEANLKFEADMIELPGGEMAVGMWFRDTVHLVMGQGPDVAAHEVVHGFLDKFATGDEKRAVLNEAKKNWGAKDDRDAEEMVADGFWEYLNKKRQGKPTNIILGHRLTGAIQRFFERVYNILRRFMDKSNDGAIQSLYDSILERRRPARRPDRIYTGFAESLRAKKAPERGGEPRRVKDILEGLKSIESKKSETTGGSGDEISTPADAKESASLFAQVRDLFGGEVPPGKVQFPQGSFEGLKDITSFAIGARDAFRNFEAVFGERYPEIIDRYMYSLVQSNAARVDMDRVWLDRLKKEIVALGIKKGSKESAAVQNYGEGNITFNDLVNQFGIEKAGAIRKADEWFRAAYDELLERVNGAMRRIYPNRPEKQIPRRKSYYRHFREFSELSGLKTIFETPANISSQLAGITQHTKPKSRWLSFAQQRLGLATKVDAVGGFLDYLPAASYATHVSPHIVKFRQLAKSLRDATEGSNNLNNFIEFLEDYANDLSGKSSPLDRVLIKYIPGGRKTLRLLDWLNNRVKANVILGNVSSSLAQVFNVPQGIGHAKQYSVVGAGDSLAQIFKPSEAMAKSSFLKARYADKIYDQFDDGLLRHTKNFAKWMLLVGDEVGTRFIWNSMYRQAQGKKVADPVKYADDWTRKMVAGRSVGEVPLLQKSKYFQLVAPFQLEVGNLWWAIGDEVKKKDFVSLVIFAFASYLFNEVAEKLRGNRVSFDIIDAMRDAFTGEQTVEQRVGRLAGEVVSNVPLGQTVASAWPEYGFKVNGYAMPTRKQLFGEGDPTRYGSGLLVIRGLQDPGFKLAMPFGGMQVKRSMDGIDAWKKGYVVVNRKQVFFEQDTENLARAFLFGKYAIPEVREYFKFREEKSQERYMAKRRNRQ